MEKGKSREVISSALAFRCVWGMDWSIGKLEVDWEWGAFQNQNSTKVKNLIIFILNVVHSVLTKVAARWKESLFINLCTHVHPMISGQ